MPEQDDLELARQLAKDASDLYARQETANAVFHLEMAQTFALFAIAEALREVEIEVEE